MQTEIILSKDNLVSTTDGLNKLLTGHPINLIGYAKRIEPGNPAGEKPSDQTNYSSLLLVPTSMGISRKASNHAWQKLTGRGIFAGIGDKIIVSENSITCIHCGESSRSSRQVTILELADVPSSKQVEGVPGGSVVCS